MQKIEVTITSIEWERIFLLSELEIKSVVELNEGLQVFLVNSAYQVEAEFEILNHDGNIIHARLNITNNGTNRCIKNGTYSIIVTDNEKYVGLVTFDGNERDMLSWDKCFRYKGTTGAYTITCMIDEYSESGRFQLLFYNTNSKEIGNIIGFSSDECKTEELKNNAVKRAGGKIKNKVKKEMKSILRKWQEKYYKLILKLYKNKRKRNIVFVSEQTTQMPLNMKCLYERMLERGVDKEYNIMFSLRDATVRKQTLRSRIRFVKLLGQCGTVIVDDHVPLLDSFVLDKETKVIQIWHAGAGFKGVGYSRWGHLGCPGPFSAHRQYTYCISGSKSINHFFSEQFGILDEQIIPTGMPRMDKYVNVAHRKEVTEKLYKEYPQFIGKKIILFAPTYRGRNKKNAYYPYDRIGFEELYAYCKENDSMVIFKMHPWVETPVPIDEKYADCFYDFTRFGDINDLFYITDLLITDYSSSMYEFILMEKPVLLYAYDKVQYATSRGFHRDYDSNVPGKICYSFDDVMYSLRNNDFEYEKVQYFKDYYFDFVDDKSCDRIIDWLIVGDLPEEYADKLNNKKEYINEIRGKSFRDEFLETESAAN